MDMLHSLSPTGSEADQSSSSSLDGARSPAKSTTGGTKHRSEPLQDADQLNLDDRIRKLESRLSLSAAVTSPPSNYSSASLPGQRGASALTKDKTKIISAVTSRSGKSSEVTGKRDRSAGNRGWLQLVLKYIQRHKLQSGISAFILIYFISTISTREKREQWREWYQELKNRALIMALQLYMKWQGM